MTVVSWDTTDMRAAGRTLGEDGTALRGESAKLTPPDTGMYGSFLANAVAMTQPAASEHNREVVSALGSATTEIGDRLVTSAVDYDEVEHNAEQTVNGIWHALGTGH